MALLAVVLVAGGVGRPATAGAEPAPSDTIESRARATARAAFARGVALSADSRWQEALDAFEEARSSWHHASIDYNIGFCERMLERPLRAARAFRRALRLHLRATEPELNAKQLAAAARYQADAERVLVHLRLRVRPAQARVRIDGAPLESDEDQLTDFYPGVRGPVGAALPEGAVVWLVPGTHRFALEVDGRRRTLSRSFPRAGPAEIDLALAAPPRPDPDPPVEDTSGLGPIGVGTAIGLGAVAAANLVTGVALAVSAASRWDDARAACPELTRCPDDRGADLADDAYLRANAATVALGLAGAAAACSVFVAVFGPEDRAGVALGADGIALRLTVE